MPPHSKRKRKLEPISLDELASDSTMTGFTAVFRIPVTEVPLPHIPSDTAAESAAATDEAATIQPETAAVSEFAQVVETQPETVGSSEQPPVGVSQEPTVGSSQSVLPFSPSASGIVIWQAEDGSIFPGRRARRIRLAQEALSALEERVYKVLWGSPKSGSDQAPAHEDFRLVRMGYDRLAKLVRANEKSVRNIIPRLINKGFLSIESPADPNQRLGTEYRVYGYAAVLADQKQKGREWVIRTGNGVLYARPYEPGAGGQTTVGFSQEPTVGPSVEIQQPTVEPRPTVTVGFCQPPTVGLGTTVINREFRSRKDLRETTTATTTNPDEAALVCEALAQYAQPDREAAETILRNARKNAPDATVDDIVYFVHQKGRVTRSGRIDNPLAFLITYVPKCFLSESWRDYGLSGETSGRQAQERAEMAWLKREQLRILDDPHATEEQKALARRILADSPPD